MSDRIEQELAAGRAVLVNTQGISMRPLLWAGKTQVLVSPLEGPLEIGDLPLAVVQPGRYRLHRLVEVRDGIYITLGDNTACPERVAPDRIIGRVTEIYRGSRRIPMDGLSYRAYRRFWLWSTPARLPVYRLRDRLHRVLSRLVRRLKAHG